jgi:hypothetical protein
MRRLVDQTRTSRSNKGGLGVWKTTTAGLAPQPSPLFAVTRLHVGGVNWGDTEPSLTRWPVADPRSQGDAERRVKQRNPRWSALGDKVGVPYKREMRSNSSARSPLTGRRGAPGCHQLRVSSSCHLNCRGCFPFQPWMHLPGWPIRQSPGQPPQQCRQCRASDIRRSSSCRRRRDRADPSDRHVLDHDSAGPILALSANSYGSEGWGFESLRAQQPTRTTIRAGSEAVR